MHLVRVYESGVSKELVSGRCMLRQLADASRLILLTRIITTLVSSVGSGVCNSIKAV